MTDGYEIRTGVDAMDLDLVHHWLSTDAYWALDDLGVRRTLLSTYDAHTVYAAHGFTPLPEPDRWMVRQAT